MLSCVRTGGSYDNADVCDTNSLLWSTSTPFCACVSTRTVQTMKLQCLRVCVKLCVCTCLLWGLLQITEVWFPAFVVCFCARKIKKHTILFITKWITCYSLFRIWDLKVKVLYLASDLVTVYSNHRMLGMRLVSLTRKNSEIGLRKQSQTSRRIPAGLILRTRKSAYCYQAAILGKTGVSTSWVIKNHTTPITIPATPP